MANLYYIRFLTHFDRDLTPQEPIAFLNPVHAGDLVQLDFDDGFNPIGEFHLVRLVTHSPAGSTLFVTRKGMTPYDLLADEERPLLDLLAAEYEGS